MTTLADYRSYFAAGWRVRALPERWNIQLQNQVLDLVRAQATARHPQTLPLSSESDGVAKHYFLKIFHRRDVLAAAKDQLRHGRAQSFWRQGIALGNAGFNVPLTIAVGCEGGWRVAKREFVLTEKIAGLPAPVFLRCREGADTAKPTRKWQNLKQLAQLIRQFHDLGFVHGDLVASNIFISSENGDAAKFYFMDNDRTRRYPTWLGQSLWKRNLIQLNRMPLPGISLQDRMRVFDAYLGEEPLLPGSRQLARWLEKRTRMRRMEVDGADPNTSFRRLMQWFPDVAR
jgi:hypothetical protein